MICRNCGQSISAIGKVCPFCKADKTADAQREMASGLFAMMAFAAVYYFRGAIYAMIAALVVGFVVFAVLSVAAAGDDKRRAAREKRRQRRNETLSE